MELATKKWPHFSYDEDTLKNLEYKFSQNNRMVIGAFKHVSDSEKDNLLVEILLMKRLKLLKLKESISTEIIFNHRLKKI